MYLDLFSFESVSGDDKERRGGGGGGGGGGGELSTLALKVMS